MKRIAIIIFLVFAVYSVQAGTGSRFRNRFYGYMGSIWDGRGGKGDGSTFSRL